MQDVTLEYVEQLANQLSTQEQRNLIARLEHQLYVAGASAKQPQSLYGIWKGKMPEDIDLDAELYEIRHEWEKELEEFGP